MSLLDYSKDKIKDSECLKLKNKEKLEYCCSNYPDDGNTVLFANFRCTRWLFRKYFRNNPVLSAISFAEGTDLSHITKIVIIDISEKTSKYTQLLCRQANHNRKEPIEVDILVCDKPAIGLGIYESVALKKSNFDKNSYDKYCKGM